MKTLEEHRKQLVESNALIRKYEYDTENDSPEIIRQKKYLINLLMKDTMKY